MAIKVEACDTWFSKCVRKRANWKCEHCGATETLQCAHLYGRRAKSVRWDGMNAVCLCFRCHHEFTANPLDFTRWLEKHLGRGHLAILNEKRNSLLKTTQAMRKDIAALKAQAKSLERECDAQ
jgi:hypothetical protein